MKYDAQINLKPDLVNPTTYNIHLLPFVATARC